MDYYFRKIVKLKREIEVQNRVIYFLIIVTIISLTITLFTSINNKKLKEDIVSSNSVQAAEMIDEFEVNIIELFPEEFELTGYCPCKQCNGNYPGITATGKTLEVGMVAMDKSIPFGTKIYIEGMGEYTNEDVGGAIKGNKIDIYFNTHEEALEFGRQFRKVWTLSSEVTE